jgi:hypothetical protein
VGPRAGLDRRGNSRPPPGFDPRNVQPVAQSLYRLSYSAQVSIKACGIPHGREHAWKREPMLATFEIHISLFVAGFASEMCDCVHYY